MNKKLLRKKLALMLATLKKKRKYYCEVEYLESTGTQYIDTGFVATENTRILAGLYTTQTGNKNWFGGNATGSGLSAYGFVFNSMSSLVVEYVFGNSGWRTVLTSGQQVVNKYFEVDFSKSGILINGVKIITPPYTNFDQQTNNLMIFARYGGSAKINGKLYYFKIYDNGTLVRDFIPVLDWNMTPCMYDKVSGQLFYNQATSGNDFSYGREIHPVDYIETDGKAYINTGYTPSGSTETEITTMLKDQTTSRFMFGCRTNNSSDVYACLAHNPNRIGYRVGNGGYLYSSGYNELNVKHTYKIANGVFYRDDEVVNATCEGATISPNSPLALLTVNTNNILDYAQTFIGNLYSCTMKENDVLVRDFIPAIDENGVGFMFDRVSHTIFDNAGTGQFSYPAREVEYLESTGTQYIDTGYPIVTSTDEIVVEYENSSTNNHKWLFGEYETNANFGITSYQQSASTIAYAYNGLVDGSKSEQYDTKHTLVANSDGLYNDGVKKSNFKSYTATWNIYLFALNHTGTSVNGYFGYGKIYSYTHKRNGSLIRNFIPVFQDGQAGMLDKVNNVFYPNVGTGTFTTGKIVEPEYE